MHLSTSAFGLIILGKEQNGGAALTALRDPWGNGEQRVLQWPSLSMGALVKLLPKPLLAGFKVCLSACALQSRCPIMMLLLLNGSSPSMGLVFPFANASSCCAVRSLCVSRWPMQRPGGARVPGTGVCARPGWEDWGKGLE